MRKPRILTFQGLYVAFVTGLMLVRLLFWMSPTHEDKLGFIYLWPATLCALALVVYRYRAKLPTGMPAALALVGWAWCTCVINGDPYLQQNQRFVLGMVSGFGVCYPTFLLGEGPGQQRLLRLWAGAVGALLAAVAWAGVYVTLTGDIIQSPFFDFALQFTNRLFVFGKHPNEVASMLVMGLFLCLFLIASGKRLWARVLWGLAFLGMFMALALTISRTAMIMAACGVGLAALLALWHRLADKGVWLRTGSSLLAGALCVLLVYGLLQGCIAGAGALRQQLARPQATATSQDMAFPGLLAAASAQEAGQDLAIQNRDLLEDLGTFTGRTHIWKSAIQTIQENPRLLLTGMLDSTVAYLPREEWGNPAYHMHNAWVAILMVMGLPGLLLYLWFMVRLVASTLRVLFGKGYAWGHRFLAIIPGVMLLSGLMETYPAIGGELMDLLYFAVSGAVVGLARPRTAKVIQG